MARPRIPLWSARLSGTISLIVWAAALPAPGQNTMPNSSRECAICHIRWVDTLVRNDQREDSMEKVLDRQTCHEPHGATNAWMLVLPPSQLCIVCHDDKTPETQPISGAPVHHIGHTNQGFEPPAALLEENATFGSNGELSCLSCHRLHDASGAKPLLIRKNEDSSLCLKCHKKEEKVVGSRHDLRLSSPETVNASAKKASESGPCGACHRIHGWARDVPDQALSRD